MAEKWVYDFAEGSKDMRELLGGKGANVAEMTRLLGDDEDPLLVSVRSGARESMPGMLDTVLNLGINDTSVEGLAKATENERFAWDSYRRFVQMFGNVSRGIDGEAFEQAISEVKSEKGVEEDTDLDTEALKELVNRFKAIYREHTDDDFPQ